MNIKKQQVYSLLYKLILLQLSKSVIKIQFPQFRVCIDLFSLIQCLGVKYMVRKGDRFYIDSNGATSKSL
ncbi:hypothetical protein [Nostoc sp.]|uniref:hypothetical protein n=1 Tax=Nostoc sp. TaxID=1180 RepID=UPI002FF91801